LDTDGQHVSDIPNGSFADFDSGQRSALADWLWRIPLLLRWDGILPFLSPTTVLSLSILQAPPPIVGLLGVLVPICVALARAGLAQRQIVHVCGDQGTLDRHLSLAIAIVLLLFLEVLSTILVLVNLGLKEWSIVALLYVGYVVFISFALRPPRDSAQSDDWMSGDYDAH
jgi:hypothetical protein